MDGSLDQRLLPQAKPEQTEGELERLRPISYDIQRITLLVLAETTVTFRERFDYFRVTVANAAPVAGDIIQIIFNQGNSVFAGRAIQLGDGGSIRLPMSENTIALRNIGTADATIIIVGVNGFDDDFTYGDSLT